MSRRIPDALLERYLADDLKGEAKANVEKALEASPSDRERLAALRADSAAFLTQHPPGQMVAKFEAQRPRRRWAWLAVVAPLLAATAAVFVITNGGKETEDEPELTVKGTVALVVHKKQGNSSAEVRPGEMLHPGDEVEFEVHAKSGFVAVVSRDATGQVSVYYPFGGSEAVRFDPRVPLLPMAIKLDETLGPEVVYAVWSEQPFQLAPVVEALKAGGEPSNAAPGLKVGRSEWNKQ